ncbi:hypothetical protein [Cupriavidus necator]
MEHVAYLKGLLQPFKGKGESGGLDQPMTWRCAPA